MWIGLACALIAGLTWGLVFIAPLLLPDYPPALLAVGRYAAFGLICLPLAGFSRAALASLRRADWIEALKLAAIGNLLYYLFLASAIQRAGGPLPTMIIGTLPVVIALASNRRNRLRDGQLPWRRLVPPLLLIAAGIACVNHAEMRALTAAGQDDLSAYAVGAAFALGALVCWTWYPLRNADWLRDHPGRSPRLWATAQGLATLPLAAVAYVVLGIAMPSGNETFIMPLGPRPLHFVGLMMAIGLFASWLGTWCWNEASQRLPTALSGQLIVFETLAALAYSFMLRGAWPEAITQIGIALLVAGVTLGMSIRPDRRNPVA